MKIKKNGKVIRLTESDLKRIVKRVLTEDDKRCKPLSHISVMDMADRSNLVKIPNGTSEFNLLDDELMDYDVEGFKIVVPNGNYKIEVMDGFPISPLYDFESKGGTVDIKDVSDLDKVYVRITCADGTEIYKSSFVPS